LRDKKLPKRIAEYMDWKYTNSTTVLDDDEAVVEVD